MARGVNKVILVGTCGQDPEVRYLPNGNAVTNLSLATSEQWTDKQTGQKVEKTEWHRVSMFGKVAEIAGEYLRKVRRSTSKANCRPASGKKTASSVTPLKSWSTCKAPCNCSAAVHRATNRARAACPTRHRVHSSRVRSQASNHSVSRAQRHSRPLRNRLRISTALMTIFRSRPYQRTPQQTKNRAADKAARFFMRLTSSKTARSATYRR